jgi:hypothetical protein
MFLSEYQDKYCSTYHYFLNKMDEKGESDVELLQFLRNDYKESVKILSHLFSDMEEKKIREKFCLNKDMFNVLLLLSNDAHSSTIKISLITSVLEMFKQIINQTFSAASEEYVSVTSSRGVFTFDDDESCGSFGEVL